MRYASATPVVPVPDLCLDDVFKRSDGFVRKEFGRIPDIVHHKDEDTVGNIYNNYGYCKNDKGRKSQFFLRFFHKKIIYQRLFAVKWLRAADLKYPFQNSIIHHVVSCT